MAWLFGGCPEPAILTRDESFLAVVGAPLVPCAARVCGRRPSLLCSRLDRCDQEAARDTEILFFLQITSQRSQELNANR